VRRKLGLPLLLAGAVLTGVIVTVAVGGGGQQPTAAPPPRVGTATVVRTDLTTTVLAAGTLGYAPARPVINRLAGTYTSLPAVGRTLRAGQVLYRVDDFPVVLMIGRTPAWRAFAAGMTAGPDVSELQRSLIALGYARGLFSLPTGQFDLWTEYAVQRWQAAAGYPVTGQIALGQIEFLPMPILVQAQNVVPGQSALPGQQPYQDAAAARTVSVPVDPALPPVSVGERVSIVLPSLARTPGRVTAIGPVPATAGSGSGSSGAPDVITVTPDMPGVTGTGTGVPVQVSLTVASARQVLAVPVSALLALAGGGYGLEIVLRSGADRLIGVTPGSFAGGLVQVSGAGLVPGTKVVVAQ